MTDELMLTMLKVDLGITASDYDQRLAILLTTPM